MKKRVLVIEDDDVQRMALSEILEEAGYVVEAVATVAKGLARHRVAPFALLLVDYQLPEADGVILAHHLARGPNPAFVILMSAHVSAEWVKEQGSPDSIYKFLRKPVLPEVLLKTIQEALGSSS